MSVNDGRTLRVFGLSFAQQDGRKMQQVLGHYHRLATVSRDSRGPPSRASLFVALNLLALHLMAKHEAGRDQIDKITRWMLNGGDFPLTSDLPGPPASSHHTDDTRGETSADAPTWGTHFHAPHTTLRRSHHFRGRGRTLDGAEHAEEEDREEAAIHDNFGHAAFEPTDLSHPPASMEDDFGSDLDRVLDVADASSESPLEHPPAAAIGQAHSLSNNEPAVEAKEVECPICLEAYPPSNYPTAETITEFCDHPDRACLQCLASSITLAVERGALHLLACPICPQKLSPQAVKQYADASVYERYAYLKQQSEIPGHWISCTNPHCGGSQPQPPEDGPRMICRHCAAATCARHRRPWHEGQTCAEFDIDDAQLERLEEEEATAKLLAQELTSICPTCGQGVTKTDGCDHMLCNCGKEWCYVCGCDWENTLRIGEAAHATFCIYHPNKVNLTKAQQEAARARILSLVHGGDVSAELSRARDEFRRRRREEMRPRIAEAAEARRKRAAEEEGLRDKGGRGAAAGGYPARNRKRVKLVAPWEEGGWTKKAL